MIFLRRRAAARSLAVGLCCALVSLPGHRAAAADRPPPAAAPSLPAPQWVGAVSRDGKVFLSWIRDQRFAAVRVYRKSADAPAFSPIGETPENSFTDETATPGGAFRYRLAAVGPDGKEGRPSAEMSVRVSETSQRPPEPPVWEGFVSVESGIGLKWGGQEGADILVHNIYRRTLPETEFQLVASVSGTSFIDTGAAPDRQHAYVLTALDSSFRETPFSAELIATFRSLRGPEEKKALPEWRPRRTRLVALVTAADQPLVRPVDVAVGPRTGNVYLSDSARNRVFVFDARGGYLRQFGGGSEAAAGYKRLLGLAVDGGETVYAVDAGREAVFAHDGGAGAGRRLGLPRATAQHAPGIVDCAVDAAGRIYAVDNTNSRVLVAGAPAAREVIGAMGFGWGEFSAPTFSAVDGDGNLYVSDSLNARVQVFSPAGEFVRAFGRIEGGAVLLGRPKGLAVRENGEILVADSWLNAIQVFDRSGRPLAILVDEKGSPLDLGSPNGIALGPGNRIYIAERLSARLQIREILDEGR